MNVLGIVCSPRKGGNTEILVCEALGAAKKGGAEIELVRISDMNIAPCDGCETCQKTGECRIKDDMQELYEKILTADGIILGSPVYFWSVSSQAKKLMDRTYALRYPHHKLRNKIAGAIVAAGRRGSVSALSIINNYFLGQDMLVVGLGIAGYGSEKGEVREDKHGMKGARSLGKTVIQTLRNMKSQKSGHSGKSVSFSIE